MNPLKRKTEMTLSPHDEKVVASELENLAQSLNLPKGKTQDETISILYFYIKNAESKGYLQKIVEKPKKNDKSVVMSPEEVPLGMKTSGNRKIDTLAKIVRLKYLEQFRDIQECVNQKINKAQTMTADPKTNMSLAKVGF
uniref:Adenylate kinase isoenzyme 6 homolog n=1 Tax=Strongyloides stercoralis TaxID=6248 RepID=A0A0K0E5R5_STRER